LAAPSQGALTRARDKAGAPLLAAAMAMQNRLLTVD